MRSFFYILPFFSVGPAYCTRIEKEGINVHVEIKNYYKLISMANSFGM